MSDRPPDTDQELEDEDGRGASGPEADPSEVEGSSGAEAGINPWDPEAYEPDATGPSQSTED